MGGTRRTDTSPAGIEGVTPAGGAGEERGNGGPAPAGTRQADPPAAGDRDGVDPASREPGRQARTTEDPAGDDPAGDDPAGEEATSRELAGRLPVAPLPAAVSATLASVAVAGFVGAWQSVTGRTGGALVVGVAVATVVLAIAALLDVALFRPGAQRATVYVLGLTGTGAGLGVLAWLGAADVLDVAAVRALAIGLILARPLLGAVQASRRPRHLWWQLLAGVGVWNAGLALYVTVGPGLPGWDELVWDTADQIGLFRYAVDLLEGEFGAFSYLLGVPMLLAPVALVTGFDGLGQVGSANLANTFVAPVQTAIVMPMFVLCVARAACRAAGVRPSAARVVAGMAVVTGLVFAYTMVTPGYVLERNADLVPRRVLGVVYGPGPLGFAALAAATLVLARCDRHWPVVPLGVVAGLVALLHERYLPTVLLFFLLVFLSSPRRWRVVAAAAVAVVTFSPQLAYFRGVYGGWLFPNRNAQWEAGDRLAMWGNVAHERFGLPADVRPPRMSLDYLPVNGADMLGAYWPVLVLTAAALLLLVWRRPNQWPVWALCGGHFAFVFLQSAMYINVIVTWRYNSLVLPVVAFVLVAALWSLVTPAHGREPAQPGPLASLRARGPGPRRRRVAELPS